MEKPEICSASILKKQLLFLLTSTLFVVVFLLHQDSFRELYRYKSLEFASDGKLSTKHALRSLVRGENLTKLESTGLSCTVDAHAEVCVISTHIIFDKRSQTIYVPSNAQSSPINRTVRPYARREDEYCMRNLVSPVQILQGKYDTIKPPACQMTHYVPTIVFSFGGYADNHFHAINDVIIPLFITSHKFHSRVQFIITDYNATWVDKYSQILRKLSSYKIIGAEDVDDYTVHCFPAGVVGLRYHDNLAVRSSEIPGDCTIESFRQFLRETYKLKRKVTLKPKRPKVLLLSRQKSRKFLNEDDLVNMIRKMGFVVHRALPNETSNLGNFAQVVNSCDMIVGAHGAGLTNQIFLPVGSVVIQIVPMALEWQSNEYFGRPAFDMGLKYFEYKVQPNETTLLELYGPDDPVIYNPGVIWTKGWPAVKPIYVDKQNFMISLNRFRSTLYEALKHFRS